MSSQRQAAPGQFSRQAALAQATSKLATVFVEDLDPVRDAWVQTASRYLVADGHARRAAHAWSAGDDAPAKRLLDFLRLDPGESLALAAARGGDVAFELWLALRRGEKTFSLREVGRERDLYSITASGPSKNAFVISIFMLCQPEGGEKNVLLGPADLTAIYVWLFAEEMSFARKHHADGEDRTLAGLFDEIRRDLRRARRRFSTVDDYGFEPRRKRLVHLPPMMQIADMTGFDS